MRLSNRQIQSKWGTPLKIPLWFYLSISHPHPFFGLFFWRGGACRNKLPPPPGFADVSKVSKVQVRARWMGRAISTGTGTGGRRIIVSETLVLQSSSDRMNE